VVATVLALDPLAGRILLRQRVNIVADLLAEGIVRVGMGDTATAIVSGLPRPAETTTRTVAAVIGLLRVEPLSKTTHRPVVTTTRMHALRDTMHPTRTLTGVRITVARRLRIIRLPAKATPANPTAVTMSVGIRL